MSPAAEWLLDNFHIISAAARDIHHDLPASFFRRLPRIAADEFAGLPRIYALARELIGSSAGRLDAQRLQRFISAFQSVTPLTMGELWAWPSALKLALLDHLRGRGDVLAATRVHRLAADRLAERLEASSAGFDGWPAHVHHSFVTRLLQRSRALGTIASRLHHQLEGMLSARGQTIEDAIRAEGQHQVVEQAGMANLSGSGATGRSSSGSSRSPPRGTASGGTPSGLGGMDVPGRRSVTPRAPAKRRDDEREPLHSNGMAALFAGVDGRPHALSLHRVESRAPVPGNRVGGARWLCG